MTLFEFEELTAYWAEHPPVHILVGAYLGISKDRHQRVPSALSRSGRGPDPELARILAELGPGFSAQNVHAGLAPVVLDFARLRRRARAGD
jgi:hypothetical protein